MWRGGGVPASRGVPAGSLRGVGVPARGVLLCKTKAPQTVTLQVKIERGRKAIKNQHAVPDHVLAYPLHRNFPAQKKTTKFSLAELPFAVF